MKHLFQRLVQAGMLASALVSTKVCGGELKPLNPLPTPTNVTCTPSHHTNSISPFLLPPLKPRTSSQLEEIWWDRIDQNFRGLAESPFLRFVSSGDALEEEHYGVRYDAYARNASEQAFKQTVREYLLDLPFVYELKSRNGIIDFLAHGVSGRPERGTLTSPDSKYVGNDVLLRDQELPKSGLRVNTSYRVSDHSFGSLKLTYGSVSAQGRLFARFDRVFGEAENILGADFIFQKSFLYQGRTPRAAITASAVMNGYTLGDGNDRVSLAFQWRLRGSHSIWDNERSPQSLLNLGISWRLATRDVFNSFEHPRVYGAFSRTF